MKTFAYKIISILVALLLVACGGVLFSPDAKDYQISVCKDFSTGVTTVKSASLTVTPAPDVATQATISNVEPLAITADPSRYSENIVIKWQQSGEDVELTLLSNSCLWDGAEYTTGCYSVKTGTISEQYVHRVGSDVTIKATIVTPNTPKAQEIHIEGSLTVTSTTGTVAFTGTTCQVHCTTSAQGRSGVDDDFSASRKCTYSCDNKSTGTINTTCGDNACTGEAASLADATHSDTVASAVSCNVTSSDFAALPPLAVTLNP